MHITTVSQFNFFCPPVSIHTATDCSGDTCERRPEETSNLTAASVRMTLLVNIMYIQDNTAELC